MLAIPFLLALWTADVQPPDRPIEVDLIRPVYEHWRDSYLTQSQRVEGGLYVDYQAKQTTCSEAIGYGMLISVMLSEIAPEQTRKDFDGLNRFRKSFASNVDDRLMAWRIDDQSTEKVATACATDGDMDIAYALLLAAERWDAPVYRDEAKRLIAAIEHSLIRDDFSLRRGDWDQTQHAVRLSDIMPVQFRAFGKVSNRKLWGQVATAHYAILKATTSREGVFPDFVVKVNGQWKAAPANYLESEHDGVMYYNSCRVPWRLAWAVLANQDMQSREIMNAFNEGIGQVPNDRFLAGYQLNGQALNDWTDGAFTAPHMCSLLVARRTEEYRRARAFQLKQRETYYQDSIRLLCLTLCQMPTE